MHLVLVFSLHTLSCFLVDIFYTFLFQINILHRVCSLYEPLVEAVKGTPGKKHSNLNYIRTSFTFWGENVGRGRIFSHFLRTNKGRQCLHNPHIGGGGGQTIQQRRGKTLSSLLLFCFPEGKQHPKSPPKNPWLKEDDRRRERTVAFTPNGVQLRCF